MIINVYVTMIQSVKNHTLFIALRQCWTVPSGENDIWLYGSNVYFLWPETAPTHNNAYPRISLVITPRLYLHHVQVAADQDSASSNLYAE